MPRINPTVTEKARKIYDSLDHHKRGEFVSDAIEEKYDREYTGIDIQKKLAELEQRIKVLEERSEVHNGK